MSDWKQFDEQEFSFWADDMPSIFINWTIFTNNTMHAWYFYPEENPATPQMSKSESD